MSRYMLTEKRPFQTQAHNMSDPSAAAESPWHYAPDEEWGKPVEHATLIYAHPDDETIFAGGLLLANPEWKWTLIRFVYGDDQRDRDHARAVSLFRAEGVNIVEATCLRMDDTWLTAADRRRWREALLVAAHEQPDVVFTHGYRGEYGHPHHIAIHHQVHTLFDNVWNFFHPSGREDEPQLLMGRVHVVPTDSRKQRIMKEAYGDMLTAITRADPAMADAQFSERPEYFTR